MPNKNKKNKEPEKKKRSRHGRAKSLDKKIVKVEWKDKLAACSHLVILVAKIDPDFISGNEPGYYKVWINLEAGGYFVHKRLRTEVVGEVERIYRERIEISLISWVIQGMIQVPLPGYFEKVRYEDRKFGLKVQVERT